MKYTLYKKIIKEALEEMMNSGQVLKIQAVEITLEKLAALDDQSINKSIDEYLSKRNEYRRQLEETTKNLNALVDKYYDQLMKDL